METSWQVAAHMIAQLIFGNHLAGQDPVRLQYIAATAADVSRVSSTALLQAGQALASGLNCFCVQKAWYMLGACQCWHATSAAAATAAVGGVQASVQSLMQST